eukprot:m.267021 g.267021  ORF g.267021 m.267021 type:complete len:100 (-) comp54710_c0_seq3:1074-1373(-)
MPTARSHEGTRVLATLRTRETECLATFQLSKQEHQSQTQRLVKKFKTATCIECSFFHGDLEKLPAVVKRQMLVLEAEASCQEGWDVVLLADKITSALTG